MSRFQTLCSVGGSAAIFWLIVGAGYLRRYTSNSFLGLAESSGACHLALCSMVFPPIDTLKCLQTGTMMVNDVASLRISAEELTSFCRRYQVRELALFGSTLRQDRRPDSDVDLLVSFVPTARVTFVTLARMQRELEVLFGHKVDLVPKDGLKPVIRDHILATARVLYAA